MLLQAVKKNLQEICIGIIQYYSGEVSIRISGNFIACWKPEIWNLALLLEKNWCLEDGGVWKKVQYAGFQGKEI